MSRSIRGPYRPLRVPPKARPAAMARARNAIRQDLKPHRLTREELIEAEMSTLAIRVPCPKCGAEPGHLCRGRTGNPSIPSHARRQADAGETR